MFLVPGKSCLEGTLLRCGMPWQILVMYSYHIDIVARYCIIPLQYVVHIGMLLFESLALNANVPDFESSRNFLVTTTLLREC
ncbi:uncharacterized protein Gasu_62180 [Galdieria sulphuraria]|uniref:Uncharacterized protein n=1 Tax=Galdieria sulphuraria TaxID=130081 RepID=M2XR41_GALSU|nr:uncharacterized protein Gasu_62180 [Galdieria sulphuraria]EME26133.1 hypothetical protein Gasu_62180 [Galdieria sulphuraria]|eukprot:XP_005702653.1 hypothetical protein Gasu_62180 [Galdieria sulphuraria]